MTGHEPGTMAHPFPAARPDIRVEPSLEPPFELDWRELLGWSIVPEVGDETMWAFYDRPAWGLTGVCWLKAVAAAKVHGVAGVEILVDDLIPGTGWGEKPGVMWARLTETTKQWLGTLWGRHEGDDRRLTTFLDPGFDATWGEWPRRMADDGWLQPVQDGAYRQVHPEGLTLGYYAGCGRCLVSIGEKTFDCLRVIGIEDTPGTAEKAVLTECYVPQDGRQVYMRHRRADTAAQYPHDVLVLDGVAYGPWYDCITALAL